jgi:hypothetical protein
VPRDVLRSFTVRDRRIVLRRKPRLNAFIAFSRQMAGKCRLTRAPPAIPC